MRLVLLEDSDDNENINTIIYTQVLGSRTKFLEEKGKILIFELAIQFS